MHRCSRLNMSMFEHAERNWSQHLDRQCKQLDCNSYTWRITRQLNRLQTGWAVHKSGVNQHFQQCGIRMRSHLIGVVGALPKFWLRKWLLHEFD